jgi:hypothetical protein
MAAESSIPVVNASFLFYFPDRIASLRLANDFDTKSVTFVQEVRDSAK